LLTIYNITWCFKVFEIFNVACQILFVNYFMAKISVLKEENETD
jgi:hypothetical protein